MNRLQRIISMTLAIVLAALLIVPLQLQTVSAADGDGGQGIFDEADVELGYGDHIPTETPDELPEFLFEVGSGAATIVGYNGDGGDVVIPSAVDGYPVTAIGNDVFASCVLNCVTIPVIIVAIGDNAFANTTLTDVYYSGVKEKWDAIVIGEGNDSLLLAKIHFCNHDFADATCMAPKTCKICGETEGEKLGHSFTNYKNNDNATCTGDGSETAVCDRCTARDTRLVENSKLGHKYSNTWDTTCNTCGEKRTVSLSNTAPTSFKATLTGYNDVKLTWKAGKGANRYYVYYRRVGKTEWKRATITTGLTYTIKDLVANGKYEFKVISYLKDSSGTYKGASTKVLTCSTTRNLKAPSKVTVKLYGYDDVKISWSKVTYANGYKVYYKRSTAKSYSYIGFTTGTSIKKANLSDGVKYTFKVVPCTKVNGSYFADDSSKTASITTLKTVSTPKVAKYTSSKVKVSWTDIAGENGYQIVVTSDKAGKKVITSSTATGKSKTLSAKKGKTYYYKVRAYKTVDGKKIYAPWSAAKAYKLK